MIRFTLILCLAFFCANIALAAELQPVEGSSLIQSAAYDAATQTLRIQMHNNTDVYVYQNVPQNVYDDFMAADSRGAYYVESIKYTFESTREE